MHRELILDDGKPNLDKNSFGIPYEKVLMFAPSDKGEHVGNITTLLPEDIKALVHELAKKKWRQERKIIKWHKEKIS